MKAQATDDIHDDEILDANDYTCLWQVVSQQLYGGVVVINHAAGSR